MADETRAPRRFLRPAEVPIPPACAGWEEMYPYHTLFADDRREFDEERFWFAEGIHMPEPLYPFDAMTFDAAVVALNQASSRLFAVPPSLGVEYRILAGYVYDSPNSVTDESVLAERAELFARRGGHYYLNWDELYARWVEKVEAATDELRAIVVPELGDFEDESVVTDGRGLGSAYALLQAYDRVLEGVDRIFQYHFEFLNLGYAAYLAFYEDCRNAFPHISDQTIAAMVSGIDVLTLRPDDELRRLARRAVDLGVSAEVEAARTEADLAAALGQSEAGREWLADFEQTKDPWFYFSCGTGVFHHHHRSWIDDAAFPIAIIGSHVARLRAGEDIARPSEAILAERERVTSGYRELLDGSARAEFDKSLALARTVFHFVEDHNFYVDHRYMAIFWNKVREFGALLAAHGFLACGEDVFYLRHDEVRAALEELRLSWSTAGAGRARGPAYWPPLVERRQSIYEAIRRWSPPPALGNVPEEITEPFTIIFWGITTERIQEWLANADGGATLRGVSGSTGIAEGLARVVLHPDQLHELEAGEILVAPTTSTSWTPVFATIAAAVLDAGGIMCHAAIVAREYRLPTVVGTGTATTRIATGDRIRVDADRGVVTILREP